jgi:hypothetical protein
MRNRSRLTAIAIAAAVVPLALVQRDCQRLQQLDESQAASNAAFAARAQERKAAEATGEERGKTRDTKGCIDWAFETVNPNVDGSCNLTMNALFGCLQTAQRNETFCATVPDAGGELFGKTEGWRRQQAAERNLPENGNCAVMFKFVQFHCYPIR